MKTLRPDQIKIIREIVEYENKQLPDDCPNCHKLVDDLDNDIHWEWSAFGQSSADTYEVSTNCPYCNAKFTEIYSCDKWFLDEREESK